MILKCITNNENLQLGQFYVVYSLFETNNLKWFLIIPHYDSAPIWYQENSFEVIESIPSKYWVSSSQSGGVGCAEGPGVLHSFREYTDDFYYNLIEGHEKEVNLFNNIAHRIRTEAVL
jgi:hypothetical protein